MIDFHTHTFPDHIAPAAIAKLQAASHSRAFTDGTMQGLKDSMARAGLAYSVVLPVATNPLKVSSMNDVSLHLTGQDGLIYFGCMHPDAENWHEELGRIAQAGLKGIKIHPVYQHTDIDDSRFLRILERCGELGLIVAMHAGDDIGFPGEVRCTPQMIARALRQVGPVKLVAAHMGGWRNWEQVAEHLLDTSAYLDTAFSLGAISPLEEGYYSPAELAMLQNKAFCQLVHAFGAHRILFGTDSPWDDQAKALQALLALPLTAKEKEQILSRSARELLALPG